jgi:gamma-glutamylcyclotransferase (GGCT)/AIG2-like uncharacterized protein YtfP
MQLNDNNKLSENTYRIAVYGSLLEGLGNHGCLNGFSPVARFRSEGIFTLHSLHGSYPGLKQEGEDSVVFEVYEVDEITNRRVQRLEGYNPDRDDNTFYDVAIIDTPRGKASTYIYQPSTDTRLESGDWYLFKTGESKELHDEIKIENTTPELSEFTE